jgi:phosphatidylinositol glycan class T
VKELHLRITQGRWKYDRWGYHDQAAPSGVGLWSFIGSDDVDKQWTGLTNALAGLFCASLNFMEPQVTVSPRHIFQPKEPKLVNQDQLRYSSIPREIVCTENLTPWLKLLPCQNKAGLARLLNAHKLLDGNYQSMSLDWVPKCLNKDCSKVEYEFIQGFTVVLDPIRTNQSKNWSMSSLFTTSFEKTCAVADETTVSLHLPQSDHQLYVPPSQLVGPKAIYNLNRDSKNLDIGVYWNDFELNHRNPQKSAIATHRFLSGSGQERGTLVVEFYNNAKTNTVISYVESIPWILKMYLHTMTIEISNEKVVPQEVLYAPAVDRKRPTLLELQLELLAESKTTLRIDYECAFVKVTEHYPDANHGFEIGYH